MNKPFHIAPEHRAGLVFVVISLALISGAFFLAIGRYPSISLEHGLMENMQVVCLLIACALFAFSSRHGQLSATPAFAMSLALFCLTFFLLEFDTRPFDIDILTRLTNGTVRNAWLGTLWIVVIVFVLQQLQTVWAIS